MHTVTAVTQKVDKVEINERGYLCRNMIIKGERDCPQCGFTSIAGISGSPGAICPNCGYKDPCCGD